MNELTILETVSKTNPADLLTAVVSLFREISNMGLDESIAHYQAVTLIESNLPLFSKERKTIKKIINALRGRIIDILREQRDGYEPLSFNLNIDEKRVVVVLDISYGEMSGLLS